MKKIALTARQRAAETHKAILRATARKRRSPAEIAKLIDNYPGPVARACRKLATEGRLHVYRDGTYLNSKNARGNQE